jgi:hypothetical protein
MSHRRRQRRCIAALDLDAEPSASAKKQQIEFRTRVSAPEVRLVGPDDPEHLFDDEAFPGCAGLRMGEQIAQRADPEQPMEDPAVTKVDLR